MSKYLKGYFLGVVLLYVLFGISPLKSLLELYLLFTIVYWGMAIIVN